MIDLPGLRLVIPSVLLFSLDMLRSICFCLTGFVRSVVLQVELLLRHFVLFLHLSELGLAQGASEPR